MLRTELNNPKTFNILDIDHKFPLIEQINDVGGRRYKFGDDLFPSITSVMSWTKASVIKEWRERVGAETANQITNKASKRGTKLHNICEAYITNQNDLGDNIDNETIDMFNLLKPSIDRSIDNIYAVEQRMFSKILGVAGTSDCVAHFDSRRAIIDFKSSLKIKPKHYINNYFMQATAYACMFEELTGIPITNIVIIMATNDEYCVYVEKRDNYLDELIDTIKRYKMSNDE